ncbi:HBS1-like protein isoform X2 [Corticium candelabrum]|uniref:HBS1-like protein isoform X2 n=1 Tax=Corticium candelabrum TaxID=121492 RepID=UPI002E25F593|nr:HBS1-like protein isoform X2 [Corticium candelabrum]
MARHRNIRRMTFEDEYEDEDAYGINAEDEVAMSPTTAQFMYRRDACANRSLSSFMTTERKPKQEEQATAAATAVASEALSEDKQLADAVRQIQDVLGRGIDESTLRKVLLQYDCDVARATDRILSDQEFEKTKPALVAAIQAATGHQHRGNEWHPSITVVSSEMLKANGTVGGVGFGSQRSLSAPNSRGMSQSASPRWYSPTPDNRKSPTSQRRNTNTRDGLHSPRGTPERHESRPSPAGTSTPERDTTVSEVTRSSTPATPSALTRKMSRQTSKNLMVDVMAELEKRKGGKEMINLVVIGHVDAGKSTLLGHVLHLLGNVSQRSMHKYESESRKAGKSSFAYAWVLDETGEERSRGITMDIAMTRFETKKKIVTLLDAPGHKDFIPNMITGAAQADVAILVVDARPGEFEAGFQAGGQTREHAVLARSLGVTQLAVAVNKMDAIEWLQGRFNEIVQKLGQFLKQAGFRESDVKYIPCSGLTGVNLIQLVEKNELSMWYKGPCLVDRIDAFKHVQRPLEKSFRCSVSDVFRIGGSGITVSGKIASGHIQVGEVVAVMPAGDQALVKAISIHDDSTQWAVAGDHVCMTLTEIDISKTPVGSMLCDPSNPVRPVLKFRARIIVFNIEIPITKGFPVMLHYQSVNEAAVINRLVSVLNKNTGEVIARKPRCLSKQSTALVEIEPARSVCVELFKDFKDLGRFMLRSGGTTIAAGIVTDIIQ